MRKRKFKMRFIYSGKPPKYGTLYLIPTISVYLYQMGHSSHIPRTIWLGPCYSVFFCFLYWKVGFDLHCYKLVAWQQGRP